MKAYEALLEEFVQKSRDILGENLVGVYLHGSAAMGCFHPEKSDLDLMIVVKKPPSSDTKRQYLDMTVALNGKAPAKGLELSLVREEVCSPFQYPTPYELHFSGAHLAWYQRDPAEYVEKMQGEDRDLAAHFTILLHRGKTLFGKPISQVFAPVPKESYWDSICGDVIEAAEEICKNPIYYILNLCRVLAYRREGLILSKEEGGAWYLEKGLDRRYAPLIESALAQYRGAPKKAFSEELSKSFARDILKQLSAPDGAKDSYS